MFFAFAFRSYPRFRFRCPHNPATLHPIRFEEHEYYAYILASRSRNLYIGVTNNLLKRTTQHRAGKADSFTARYKIHRLVYFERFQYIDNAIAREKFLKHLTRAEKIALVESINPTWQDLADDYFKRRVTS